MNTTIEETHPTLFEHPLTFLVTHLAMPLLTTAATAYIYWLSCDALDGALAGKAVAALAWSAAFPLVALGVLLARPAKMNSWLMLAWSIAGAIFLYLAIPVLSEMTGKIDSWIVGPTPVFAIFAGMMPLIFAGLARVATAKWRIEGGGDIAISLGCLIIGPAFVYFASTVSFRVWRSLVSLFPDSALTEAILAHVMAVGFMVLSAIFFIGLLRIMHVIVTATRNCLPEKFSRIVGAVVFALALPLGGLALNLIIPFPADFANPWAWGLTIFTAATLSIPVHPNPAGLAAFFLRFVAAPFVLYFFILFLPFLPLAIPAIIAVGTGFLILAPTLLFRYWTRDAARAWRVLRERYSRRALVAAALAGALVMPAAFCIDAELERRDVKALIAWHTGEDFDLPPAPMPVSQARAEKIMRGVNDYTFGAEIPFLTAWRTWRVYDGMYMADKLRNELNRRILGKNVGDSRDSATVQRNDFAGAMFAFTTARSTPGRRMRMGWGRPRRAESFSVSTRPADDADGGTLKTVRFETTASLERCEFVADLLLPPGAWIEGMRLKMENGEWKTARPSERKAAEWVYNQIVRPQQRDPSLVTLDSPTSGRLRVFPVGPEGREVELTVRLPGDNFAPFVVAVDLPGEEASPMGPQTEAAMYTAKGADLTVANNSWFDAHKDAMAPSVASDKKEWMDINDPELMQKLRRRLRSRAKEMGTVDLGVLPSFAFAAGTAPDAPVIDITATNILSRADLAILWRELPGIASLGDIPVDGWFSLETEDGRRVAVPWRKADGGAIVFASIKGATEIDGAWAQGAKAWELENRAFLYPALDVRRELLEMTRNTGTLTTKSAYIVLETAAQEKGLAQKEMEALHGDKSLDFDEPMADKGDAPGFFVLVAAFLAVLFFRKKFGRKYFS